MGTWPRGLLALAVALAALVLAAPTVLALGPAPEFGPPTAVATASGVGGLSELETGDINGDGITDAIVTRLTFPVAHETHPVGIFLGDGHGGFHDGSSLWSGPPPQTEHGRQILIRDFNGDGRNDIFVADHGYDAAPFPGHPNTLALSTPDGRLIDASANLPRDPDFSHSATAGDVDGDGDVDIYVGNSCCGGMPPPMLLLNDGQGHFSPGDGRLPTTVTDTSMNSYTRSLFLDSNRDGSPDLVLGAFRDNGSTVLLNDGTGHFSEVPNAMPPKAFGPDSIAISFGALDANTDGVPDLIVGFQRNDFSGRKLQVLIGNGDGTFRDETAGRLADPPDPNASWPYAIRVADLNEDGRADFAVSPNSGSAEVPVIYLDDGSGVFRAHAAGPQAPPIFIFAFLDADSDGHLDLFSSTGGQEERHQVQLQLTDADGDGVEDSADSCPAVATPDHADAGKAGNGCPGALLVARGTPKIKKRPLRLATSVEASCPPTGVVCQGGVELVAKGRRLGRANIRVASGTTSMVECKISARRALALHAAHKIRVRAIVKLTGPDGKTRRLIRAALIRGFGRSH